MSDGFEHVSKERPCAVCSRVDWCYRLRHFHVCNRVKSDRPLEKGGWLHPREIDPSQKSEPYSPPRRPRLTDNQLEEIWRPIALKAYAIGRGELPRLSAQLGVSVAALERLEVGYTELQGTLCWTFPERNARSQIIGISRRLVTPNRDGKTKMRAKGGRSGLTYPYAGLYPWVPGPQTVLLTEGGTDTAAGLTIGLRIVGRPNNIGGIDMLAVLLKDCKCPIIVIGERDKKPPLYVAQKNPDHDPKCRCCLRCYPGKAGAIQTAQQLSERLERSVRMLMPPAGIKDLREYVRSLRLDLNDRAACYRAGDALRHGHF